MPTQPAILGPARLGNFRLGYRPAALTPIRRARVRITLGTIEASGADAPTRVRLGSLAIHDVLNDAPNTCTFTAEGVAPVVGQAVRISVNSDDPVLLFTGTIQQPDLTYTKRPDLLEWDCSAIDDSARLNRKLPFGTWVNVSATVIAQAILPTGFTGFHIQAGLPLVSIILDGTSTVTNALAQLATLIGGYCYIDDGDVHLFLDEITAVPDPLDGTPGRFADDPPITMRIDDSQVRTRVYGKGHGEAVLIDIVVGETILPIADAVLFNPLGGLAIGGTTPDGAASQRIAYTGVQLGTGGTLIGPGTTPVVPLNIVPGGGGSIENGPHAYAYTWVTALGETRPSPLRSVTLGDLAAPTLAPVVWQSLDTNGYATAGWAPGDTLTVAYVYAADASVTYCTAPGPTASIVLEAAPAFPTALRNIEVSGVSSPDPNAVAVQVFISHNGGPFQRCSLQPFGFTPGGGTWRLFGGVFGGTVGPTTLPAPNPSVRRVALSVIAVGPDSTTTRKVYRTAVGSAVLRLLTTLADNTTTTYADAAADGALGAIAPTDDTSGLAQINTGMTANGGGFYTESSVLFPADGTAAIATSAAPVFASVSYSFAAGDVGAVLYIRSGTNWIPGRYPIVAVASGAATLSAPCAIVANPVNASFGIDYSVRPSPQVVYTDLVIAGSEQQFSSSAHPVGKNLIGNVINISDGIGFFAQRAVVLSIAGTLAKVDRTLGTLGSTGGRGNLGGANAAAVASASATPAGSSTLPLASAAPFRSTGGWAQLPGDQVVRYTGISGNTLTGIPANGPGAILTTVTYGGHAVAAPALTGVTGLALAMLKGTTVHIWVQRDDLAAQAALIALEVAQGRVSDGIVEHLITDDRRGEDSLRALCDADLALFSRPIVTVTYATRDTKTKSGKPIVIDLVSPPIHETLTIQEVAISQIDQYPGTAPLFTVTASSVRFSLEDLLRHLAAGAGA